MTKRVMAEGRVINGKLYSKGDPIDVSGDQEKELDELGLLKAPEKAESKPQAESKAKAEPKAKGGKE